MGQEELALSESQRGTVRTLVSLNAKEPFDALVRECEYEIADIKILLDGLTALREANLLDLANFTRLTKWQDTNGFLTAIDENVCTLAVAYFLKVIGADRLFGLSRDVFEDLISDTSQRLSILGYTAYLNDQPSENGIIYPSEQFIDTILNLSHEQAERAINLLDEIHSHPDGGGEELKKVSTFDEVLTDNGTGFYSNNSYTPSNLATAAEEETDHDRRRKPARIDNETPEAAGPSSPSRLLAAPNSDEQTNRRKTMTPEERAKQTLEMLKSLSPNTLVKDGVAPILDSPISEHHEESIDELSESQCDAFLSVLKLYFDNKNDELKEQIKKIIQLDDWHDGCNEIKTVLDGIRSLQDDHLFNLDNFMTLMTSQTYKTDAMENMYDEDDYLVDEYGPHIFFVYLRKAHSYGLLNQETLTKLVSSHTYLHIFACMRFIKDDSTELAGLVKTLFELEKDQCEQISQFLAGLPSSDDYGELDYSAYSKPTLYAQIFGCPADLKLGNLSSQDDVIDFVVNDVAPFIAKQAEKIKQLQAKLAETQAQLAEAQAKLQHHDTDGHRTKRRRINDDLKTGDQRTISNFFSANTCGADDSSASKPSFW
jgi:hypothetical protein